MEKIRAVSVGRKVTPFGWVTSALGAVIVGSGLIDALTSPSGGGLGSAWTWVWVVVTVVVAAVPLVLGDRSVRVVGFAGACVFFAVTTLQVAVSTAPIGTVNNLVLWPMVACYLGWSFRRLPARVITGVAFAASGAALVVNTQDQIGIVWLNLMLASVFCLEAASFLRVRLDREISTDPLTGVLNRAGLDERIDVELGRAARTGAPVTIAILDLDDFKRINDERGHSAGDQLLVEFAASLRAHVRPLGSVVRIGGDEFLLVLPAMESSQAAELLEGIREDVHEHWSYGLATGTPDDTAHTIRDRADSALYAQKQHRKGL
ncbi:GGDEF domain-containing protein [Herbiconiux sp.]|uniref:GGDEF domain-containing protein n=1 Tax=Herbiconiux sp. TaxID=1871186 RepID=UPI0025BB2107|nr:GGDEF domain-containing protein [Herbiconiux sp.]